MESRIAEGCYGVYGSYRGHEVYSSWSFSLVGQKGGIVCSNEDAGGGLGDILGAEHDGSQRRQIQEGLLTG